MKRICAITIALATLNSGVAFAQERPDYVSQLDTDHDGAISRTEYDAMQTDHFNRQDLNHDGQLGTDEPHYGPPMTRAEYAAQAFGVFDNADADHDGLLTGEEIDALRALISPANRQQAPG